MTWWKSIAEIFTKDTPTAPEAPSNDRVMQVSTENGHSLISRDSLRKTKPISPASPEAVASQAAKRETVKSELARELHLMLKPLGYKRVGNHWSKESDIGKSRFEFQKSSYGFDCYFNATAIRLGDRRSRGNPYVSQNPPFYRIAQFCPELPRFDVVDGLSYARLHDEPEFKFSVMTVIRARMIPWMELVHKLPHDHALPVPSDMVSVQIFR